MRGTSWARVTATASVLIGVVILVDISPAGAGVRWGADYFPNVPLITQDGETVRFYDDLLKGKAVVINVMYTSCKDVCSLETARLVEAKKLLGDQVGQGIFFYSISIDPKRDTPAVLKAYAEKFHVGPGWLFLTGKKADITLVQQKLGLWSSTDAANLDGHLPSLMIGHEPTGQWMRNSAVDNPRFLATTIRDFLVERQNRPAETGKSYAVARPLEGLDVGSYLFQTRCSACHTIGRGDKIGPDLLGVTTRRDRTWITRMIRTPDELLTERDPIAAQLFEKYQQVRMPNLRLGPGDVAALIRYLETQSGGRQAAQEDPLANVPGDATAPAHRHHQHEEGEVR